MYAGGGLLITMVPALNSTEKPWDNGEAGVAIAAVSEATHTRRSLAPGVQGFVEYMSRDSDDRRQYSVRYGFDVKERPYTGNYSCWDCLAIENARAGGKLEVEYLLDDPARNRPVGAMTRGKLRWWRFMAALGAVLLVVGLVARIIRGAEPD
jgi:hypothetical protein